MWEHVGKQQQGDSLPVSSAKILSTMTQFLNRHFFFEIMHEESDHDNPCGRYSIVN